MHPNELKMLNIQAKLQDSLKIIRMYDWLLDSYVLDFYVDNHWEKMPKSWNECLADSPPELLSDLLIPPENCAEKIVWPLSLLALRKGLQRLCISRNVRNIEHHKTMPHLEKPKMNGMTNQNDPNNNATVDFNCLTHPKINAILTKKNIKEKKRHEIKRMSQLSAGIASKLDVKYIVDFGSGLGHLARLLAYGHKLNVCCLEKERTLTMQANELDSQMADLVRRFSPDGMNFRRPVHLNMCLNRDTSFKDLVQNIRKCFQVDENDATFKFGIIGLHPCGDLASILTNFFLQSSEAKFLNLVGCCYFKMTTSHDLNANVANRGYPLSGYLLRIDNHKDIPPILQSRLSFEAREIACHAIEVYAKRLAEMNYDYLRIHSFRAAIERIICKYWPNQKHSGLRSIKKLTAFRDYCEQAVIHLDGVRIPDHEIDSPETLLNLSRWKFVVIFYTLRLMLAPIVESAILYDRILCLLENGCHTNIEAIFDPVISPRNHIITAIRS